MTTRHPTSPKGIALALQALLAIASILGAGSGSVAGDWPMWRYDAGRTASSPEELPETLHLQWALALPSPEPAWPEVNAKLQFDRLYEPVVVAGLLIVPSMVSDHVTAYDLDRGEEVWRFVTEGPVRFAPAGWRDRVFVVSDDGRLYCLDARTGSLHWRFRGGPSNRKVIGNERMVSMWPARGAPVVYGDQVYFAASIWPFMGTFIHALDAESGRVVWTNSGSGSDWIVQQHSSPAFAGVSPQGYMAATEEYLVVSGGRTVPAVYDRKTGDFRHFVVGSRSMGSKGGGGYEVTVGPDFYLNKGAMYRLDNGQFVLSLDTPVITEHAMIAADSGGISGYRPGWTVTESKDRRGRTVRKNEVVKIWNARVDGDIDHIFLRAGNRLYARGAEGRVIAIDLPSYARGARVCWSAKVSGTPLNMLAAHERLVVSTDRGDIYCFGGEERQVTVPPPVDLTLVPYGSEWSFLDSGSDPGEGWIDPSFDDGAWARGEGQLGYGDGDESTEIGFGPNPRRKHITTYFRTAFQLPSGVRVKELQADLIVDDGAIVWINGQEAGRLFMPAGAVTHETAASKGVDESKEYRLTISSSLLTPGRNVIAVEVHQVSPTSSDVSFDLRLRATTDRLAAAAAELASTPPDPSSELAAEAIEVTGVQGGYALVLGAGGVRVAEELALRTDLHTIILEPDAEEAAIARARLLEHGLYGRRVAVIDGRLQDDLLPEYFAELVVAPALPPEGASATRDLVSSLFRLLRPFSGAACLRISPEEHAALERVANAAPLDGGKVSRRGDLTLLRRERAPEGAGVWTHQYGDSANTVTSRDTLVKAPLGLLWFGGPSNEEVLPRHGHGPAPHVIGGRLFIEGRNMLRAVDIYTGRLLWQRDLPDLGRFYDYTDHQPSANAIGSNYVSTLDGVWVIYEGACLRLDPATGEIVSRYRVADGPDAEGPIDLGFIAAWGDQLFLGTRPTRFVALDFQAQDLAGLKADALEKAAALVGSWKGFEPVARGRKPLRAWFVANLNKLLFDREMVSRIPGPVRTAAKAGAVETELAALLDAEPDLPGDDPRALILKRRLLGAYYKLPVPAAVPVGKFGSMARSASKELRALDRATGETRWRVRAEQLFRHNAIAIGGGKAFCIDRMLDAQISYRRRRGLPVEGSARLRALDARTGKEVWSTSERVFGTWLGYSEDHDVLLQGGSKARDRALDEVGKGMVAYRGADGSVLWQNDASYEGPCILLGRSVITQGHSTPGWSLDLLTGETRVQRHPVSGRDVRWEYTRNYGCNTAIASPHLMTFRSAAAGFYDLLGQSGTGNLGGFRTGCTSNLIPAGGVLSAPDYTRTCTCSYQNQTSLGLIHMPEAEIWTFNRFPSRETPVRLLGLNFGAPGDRRGPDSTFWLDWPSVGGPSPDPAVTLVSGDPAVRRTHSALMRGDELPWVGASSIEGEAELAIRLVRPPDLSIPNQVPGRPPVEVRGGAISAEVSGSAEPGGVTGRGSLQHGGGRGGIAATIPGHAALRSESVTVEYWVRVDGKFVHVDATGGDDSGQGWVISSPKPSVTYWLRDDQATDGRRSERIDSGVDIQGSGWHHVAFSYDAASGVGILRIDGEEVGRHDGPDGHPLRWEDEAPDVVLAKGPGAVNRTRMDELRIASRALKTSELLCADSPDEVSPRDLASDIIGYWRMEPDRVPVPAQYSVRLVFAEPDEVPAGERVFDVWLQDERCLEGFDPVAEAGGPLRTVVREFPSVRVDRFLRIRLEGRPGKRPPVLAGVRVMARRESL